MVARLAPLQTPLKLTPENHPENAPVEPVEQPTTVSLASVVGIGSLCSLVGMTIGSAALSTSFFDGDFREVACMLPLVATAAALLGGWVGAFFYMVRSDRQKSSP